MSTVISELNHFMRKCSELEADIAEKDKRIAELEAKIKEYLLKFGYHTEKCSTRFGSECNCGWLGLEQTLREAKDCDEAKT